MAEPRTRRPYTDDEKRQVLAEVAKYPTIREGCERQDMRPQTVYQWLKQARWRRYYDDMCTLAGEDDQVRMLQPVLAKLHAQLQRAAHGDQEPSAYVPVLLQLAQDAFRRGMQADQGVDPEEASLDDLVDSGAEDVAVIGGRMKLTDMQKLLTLIQQTNATIRALKKDAPKGESENDEEESPDMDSGSPLGLD